jgi:hypothetical protein
MSDRTETVAGLWIDHREAIVVTLSDKSEEIQRILSNVEKQLGRIKGKRSTTSFESQLVQADDRQQRGLTKHLNGFYSKVLSCVRDARCVLVLGPGEAKGEFKKVMAQDGHYEGAITMEPADKMTVRQIAARVKNWYANKNG